MIRSSSSPARRRGSAAACCGSSPATGRVVIERVNLVKRHTKPTQRNPRGGILEKEGSVEGSNVSLWCGKCVAPRRARVEEQEGHKKRRVCIKCGTAFETA